MSWTWDVLVIGGGRRRFLVTLNRRRSRRQCSRGQDRASTLKRTKANGKLRPAGHLDRIPVSGRYALLRHRKPRYRPLMDEVFRLGQITITIPGTPDILGDARTHYWSMVDRLKCQLERETGGPVTIAETETKLRALGITAPKTEQAVPVPALPSFAGGRQDAEGREALHYAKAIQRNQSSDGADGSRTRDRAVATGAVTAGRRSSGCRSGLARCSNAPARRSNHRDDHLTVHAGHAHGSSAGHRGPIRSDLDLDGDQDRREAGRATQCSTRARSRRRLSYDYIPFEVGGQPDHRHVWMDSELERPLVRRDIDALEECGHYSRFGSAHRQF